MAEFTGERVIPGEVNVDLLNEHVARYAFAARRAGGKRVLDAGCGVGYGSARLARQARQVIGVEIAGEALEVARERYTAPGLAFVRGDCRALPLPDGSFDLIVAFEVIEHLEQWDRLLAESRRVLSDRGELIVSTPNRLYYAEQRETANPYHVHEFDYAEFRAALEQHFPHVRIFLENHTDTVVFATSVSSDIEAAVESMTGEPDQSHFFVAVCSPQPMPGTPAFLYVPQSGNVLREREQHITLLERELEQKNRWLEEAKESLAQLHRVHQELERESAEAIRDLQEDNARKTEWNQMTGAELERVKGILEELQAAYQERTQWAVRLEAERAELEANYKRLAEESEKVRNDLKTCVDQLHGTEEELERRTAWAESLGREITELTARIQALSGDLTAIASWPAYRIGRRLGLAPRVGEKPKEGPK